MIKQRIKLHPETIAEIKEHLKDGLKPYAIANYLGIPDYLVYYIANPEIRKVQTKKWIENNKERYKKQLSIYHKKYAKAKRHKCLDCSKLVSKNATRCRRHHIINNHKLHVYGGKRTKIHHR
jgi:hypothetical protein